jgi:drug/metabolite transporter (DMT)-like permease
VLGIALALLASACYGVSNFIGPLLGRELPVAAVMLIGQSASLVASMGVLALDGSAVPNGAALATALLAGAGNAVGLAGYYRAAGLGPLSIVAPIGALGAVVPVVVGLSSGEDLGGAQALGICTALAGVALVSRPASAERAGGTYPRDRGRAVAYALVAAAGFGVFLAAIDGAADDGAFWAVAVSRASLVALLLAGGLALRATITVGARDVPRVTVPGLLLFSGTLSYSFATQEGQLSVVSVLGSLFPIFTVTLAFVLLRERLGRAQAAGVAATLAGVVLISAQV